MRTARRRGRVAIHPERCIGCGQCILACRQGCLELSPQINAGGIHPARYTADGCLADGLCASACPEPEAITVLREM